MKVAYINQGKQKETKILHSFNKMNPDFDEAFDQNIGVSTKMRSSSQYESMRSLSKSQEMINSSSYTAIF
jgi:hypothetical protein